MWLKSLYCFHFIVFSDNYFRKSFQDALSGKQSNRGNWYKYANDTILRWAIPASSGTVLQQMIPSSQHTWSRLGFWRWALPLQQAFEQVPNTSNPQSPYLSQRDHYMIDCLEGWRGEHLSMLIITYSILSIELILIMQSTVSWHNSKMASNSISMVLNCFSSEITMVYVTRQRN